MILHPRTEQEYRDALQHLEIIDMLRSCGQGYNPPMIESTPWIRTRWPNPKYL